MNWYNKTYEEIIKDCNSNINGITDNEAKLRSEKFGLNKLIEAKKRSLFLKFLDEFKNVMIIILIIAAVLSGFVGEITDTIIILVVVFLNAILRSITRI
ncbi:MAG: cation-transporting P-type ATPase [Clostridia bacterium]